MCRARVKDRVRCYGLPYGSKVKVHPNFDKGFHKILNAIGDIRKFGTI